MDALGERARDDASVDVTPLERTPGEALLHRLRGVYDSMVALGEAHRPSEPSSEHLASALNLLHYLALRRFDLRDVHEPLAALGLSSLGRAEGHALDNVRAVLGHLQRLTGEAIVLQAPTDEPVTLAGGARRLLDNTRSVFGPAPDGREVRIMVTMPSEAASEPALVKSLMDAGMDVMRINCAHDDAHAWSAMIAHLRTAEAHSGRRCRVFMDLAGPKVRTGLIAPGPKVVRWRPQRDERGRVIVPARIWLTSMQSPTHPPEALSVGDAVLPIPQQQLMALHKGDTLRFTDARKRRARLTITDVLPGGLWASAESTAYIEPTTVMYAPRERRFTPGDLPSLAQTITVRISDTLILTADPSPGQPATFDAAGRVVEPARIPFTLPEAFVSCVAGQPIFLDDGKIGAVIEQAALDHLRLKITHARDEGASLAADKGINLPETMLALPALTPKDEADLRFVAAHADVVGYSFVRRRSDVEELQVRLRELGREELGVVLKIETQRAFRNLPALLLQLMHSRSSGVMIARGDLAVECGYQRLAEVQEEILWLCEAAHVPVVWATQVLDRLAKKGQPTRAEITDAAMSGRAECVMLNKGPYIVRAVATLDDILRRMQEHVYKKRQTLRPLALARAFGE